MSNNTPKQPVPRVMWATTAMHRLGDISRSSGDFCFVTKRDDGSYGGAWVTGFGFIGVRFPAETTRELTDEERAKYDSKRLAIGGMEIAKPTLSDK